MVAVQQLPLPEKNFGLRGQKFGFRAFYSPLEEIEGGSFWKVRRLRWVIPGGRRPPAREASMPPAGTRRRAAERLELLVVIKTKVVQNVNTVSESQ